MQRLVIEIGLTFLFVIIGYISLYYLTKNEKV